MTTLHTLHGLVLWGISAALSYAMPRLTRPELYFAVTVRAAFRARPEARSILRGYHRRVVGYAALALIPIGLGAWRDQAAWYSVGTLALTLGSTHAFLVARRAVAPFAVAPSSEREAGLAPRPGLPGGIIAQLGPFVLLAATAARAAREPSPYGALAAAALLCGALLVTARCLAYQSPQIHAAGRAQRDERRFRRITLGVVLGAEYLTAGKACGAALWPAHDTPDAVRAAIELATLGLVLVTTIVATQLGQGGGRHAPTSSAAPIGDRTRDAHWTWGVIYANRDDPAVFVEKRFGIGYALNLGNPRAWGLVVLFLVAAGASVLARR